ncbi:classes I and II family protein [Rutstroemia sp. NJR-2017a WRK4]|nr:classes I and II family protein [Rutstroemia sp. NJR-2017a WRK4]
MKISQRPSVQSAHDFEQSLLLTISIIHGDRRSISRRPTIRLSLSPKVSPLLTPEPSASRRLSSSSWYLISPPRVYLSPYLPLTETNGDGWAAERLLVKRFTEAGVLMDAGEGYRAPHPGRFRLMFTIDESTLREGFRRLLSAILKY